MSAVLMPDMYEDIRYPSTFMAGTATLKCVNDVVPTVVNVSTAYCSATVIHPQAYHGRHYVSAIGSSLLGLLDIESATWSEASNEGYTYLSTDASVYRVVAQCVEVSATCSLDNANGTVYIGLAPFISGVTPAGDHLTGAMATDANTSISIPMTELVQSDGVIVTNFPLGFENTGVLYVAASPYGTRFTMKYPGSSLDGQIIDNGVFVATSGTNAYCGSITIKITTLYEYLPMVWGSQIDVGVTIGDVERVLPMLSAAMSKHKSTNLTRMFTRAIKSVAGYGKDFIAAAVSELSAGIIPKSLVRKGLDWALGPTFGPGLRQPIFRGFQSPLANGDRYKILAICRDAGIEPPADVKMKAKDFLDSILYERKEESFETVSIKSKPRK